MSEERENASKQVTLKSCELWAALRDLSDYDMENMSEFDFDLWKALNKHPRIQEKLDKK